MPILRSSRKLNRLNSLKKMGLIGTVATLLSSPAMAEVYKTKLGIDGGYVKIEVLDDDLLHVEYGTGSGPAVSSDITTTPMIFKKDYQGPDAIQANETQLVTDELSVNINNQGCLTIHDLQMGLDVTTLCPDSLTASPKRLSMQKNTLNQVYGLGQKLTDIYQSDANGEWLGRGGFGTFGEFGNAFGAMTINGGYAGGSSGQLQFPIMYAAGSQGENIAVLLDNQYKQNWSLNGSWWNVSMYGEIRFYVMTGDSLLDLRKDYMELTGRAPVPPKKAFGLWVSEFGYEDWNEVDDTLGTLRNSDFPVDGFVLDLLWFGGYHKNSSSTPMGTLSWDEGRFPNPSSKIASYKNDDIGLITIEESYVGTGSDTYSSMNPQGYLAKYCGGNTTVTFSDWIGDVGMVDWSNPNAGAWWHDHRRKPNLIDKGIVGHWTDLGEPEKYRSNACYYGVNGDNTQGAVHNLYNLQWTESIYQGYVRNHDSTPARPFSLARAGTVGTHRFGAAMWSGDIGGRLDHMASSLNAQMHMAFAGIDYYGSDIGGFWRFTSGSDTNAPYGASESEMYTLWFANSAWFDVPVRPHGMAYEGFGDVSDQCPHNCRNETSPARMGNANSNLLNIRQRYELTPYYYSLAHRAYLTGEPVIAPLVMYYQNDANVKGMGNEKLIGDSLLVAMAYKQSVDSRDVYLPAGTWVNYHTNEWIDSNGEWLNNQPIWIAAESRKRLPAYAKAGAIIPKMHVDSQTKDVFGNRKDGSVRNELIVQVYADEQASEFTLVEDDGTDVSRYDANERPIYDSRSVLLSQQISGENIQVSIDAAQGHYAGVSERNNEVRLIVRDKTASAVFVNGETLAAISKQEFYAQNDSQGWYQESANELRIRTGVKAVSQGLDIIAYTGTGPVAPVANAGADVEIYMGESASFDGSASADANGDIASYSWASSVFSTDLSGVAANFTFDAAGDYDVVLTVTDSEGNSDNDVVTVTVIDPNAPVAPVANAGSDIQVNINELVTFDASASSDFNDDIATYTWFSAAFASDLTGVNADFSFSQVGQYEITLTVTDSEGLTDQDTVTISVIDPNACDYQFSQVYFRGTSNSWNTTAMTKVGNCIWEVEQVFDGSSQDRFKLDINGDWSHNYGDTGADGSLERTGSDIFLNADAGTYIIAMNDEFMTYTITKKPDEPIAPIANAGSDISIKVGTHFTLDGSSSSDSDGTITTYSWDNGFGSGKVVNASFDAVGVYTVNLTVTDSDGLSASDSLTVTVVANQAPIADAGEAQTVKVGSTVVLDASASTDSDGSISAYSWSNDLGDSAQVAVVLDIVGEYSYSVTVIDDNGATAIADVKITVLENQAPIANAGPDQTVAYGTAVDLSAVASSDADGEISTYSWSNGLGNTAAVSTAPLTVGTYTYTVTVTDDSGATASDSVVITVQENQAPIADAGRDLSVANGTVVNLDASASSDSDGTITRYSWSHGLGAAAQVATAELTEGVYTFTVTVTDNYGAVATDEVVITVSANQAPVADAGSDITVTEGESFNFDGSGSTDADGTIAGYSWDVGLAGLKPNHSFDEAGVYTVTLTVTDNNGASSTDTVVVTVEALPEDIDTGFTCFNGNTAMGYSVYVVGDIPELGNWTVASNAQKLSPTDYPTWSGTVALPASTRVKWKCVIANESTLAISQWQGGSDNSVSTGNSAVVTTSGSF